MPVNVSELIDRSPIGGFQIRVVALCVMVALLDGLDIQTMALVTPRLREQWGLPASAFGPVLSASFAGIMLGTMGCGLLGDRFGRRRVLLAAFALVGVTSLLTALARSPGELIGYRFLTGLAIGGCLPNATALIAEYVPSKRLAQFVTLMFSAVPLGGVLGGYVAGDLIEAYDWRAVFIMGGVIPLILSIVLFFALPESVRFLAARGRSNANAGAILSRIDRSYVYAPDDQFVLGSGPAKAPLSELFAHGRAPVTLMLWVVFFFSLFGMYMLTSWLPSVFTELGWPMNRAIRSVSYFQLGGIFGGLLGGYLIDRFGPYRVLPGAFVFAGLLTAAVGMAGGAGGLITAIVALAGAGVVGAQIGMTALAANLYPTAARATGVGWGLGIGRIGAVISPTVGGFAVAAQWPQSQLFAAAAVPPLICAAALLVMWSADRRRQTRLAAAAPPLATTA